MRRGQQREIASQTVRHRTARSRETVKRIFGIPSHRVAARFDQMKSVPRFAKHLLSLPFTELAYLN